MLQFTKLDKNVNIIKPYLLTKKEPFCDLSVGVKYMWRDDFIIDYAIYNDTLIMKETCPDYKDAFYFPLGKDVEGALSQIEDYTTKNFMPLQFCCIDNQTAAYLNQRYNSVSITNDRDWSDYIYDAEKFKTYSGKKYSGQRNHVNKFTKLYPDYIFKQIEREDFAKIKEFLDAYNSKNEYLRWSEKVEQQKVFDLVENMFELDQVGGLIEVDGKVVAFSVGEKINDTLIVHIEKALTEYAGVYPTMAKEFAVHFADKGIKYINREEDCGDVGLRISKLQYGPIDVKEKNLIKVKTLFDKIGAMVHITAEDLVLTDHNERDMVDYYELYTDDDLNKWWGYDYREDLGDGAPTPEYFYSFQNLLKQRKEEYSLLVKKQGIVLGEVVLHNFDYFGGVEVGFRLKREHHGKGYATIAVKALIDYAFETLGAKKVKTRCFKQNQPSFNLIKRLGFTKESQSDTHYFFSMERK